MILATGNNLTFAGDMTTRALVCRIDARMERPETRRFDVDLKSEIPRRRPELVAAGLTLLRAFVVAGRPGLGQLEPFGRFEAWSNLIRGSLVWAGEPDPCLTRSFIASADPERDTLIKLLGAIRSMTNGNWNTAGEIIRLAEVNDMQEHRSELGEEDFDDTAEMLSEALSDAVTKYTGKSLGAYLRRFEERIVGGLRLEGRDDKHRKQRVYRVIRSG